MNTVKGKVTHTKKFIATGKPRQDYKLETKLPYIKGSAEFYIKDDKCVSSLEDADITKHQGFKVAVIEVGSPGFIFSFLEVEPSDTPKLGTEIVVKYKVEVDEHV